MQFKSFNELGFIWKKGFKKKKVFATIPYQSIIYSFFFKSRLLVDLLQEHSYGKISMNRARDISVTSLSTASANLPIN